MSFPDLRFHSAAAFGVWKTGQSPGTQLDSFGKQVLQFHCAQAGPLLELLIEGSPAMVGVEFAQKADHLPVLVGNGRDAAFCSKTFEDVFRPVGKIGEEAFVVKNDLATGNASHSLAKIRLLRFLRYIHDSARMRQQALP